MTEIQLPPPPVPDVVILPRSRVWCETKATWADEWAVTPYLSPMRYRLALAPGMDEATFTYAYGQIFREDRDALESFTPKILDGQYVRIREQSGENDAFTRWTGVFETEANRLLGQPVEETTTLEQKPGDQRFTAYGMAHLLDREPINNSMFMEDDPNIGYTIDRVHPFNQPGTIGGVVGNRSAVKLLDSVYVYSADAEVWTNRQAVDYLLLLYKPEPLSISLAGAPELLDDIETVTPVAGLTLYQALNRLIPRQRGVGWRLEVSNPNSTAASDLQVVVFSVLDVDLKVDDAVTIPANGQRVTLNLTSENELQSSVTHRSIAEAYTTVRAEGGFITSCFHLSHADGTLIKNWTDEDEESYNTGVGTDPKVNDEARRVDAYKAVYSQFTIPDGWDWRVRDGVGGDTTWSASPVLILGEFFATADNPVFTFGKSFTRSLPLLDVTGKAYLAPLAVGEKDGVFYQLDLIDQEKLNPVRVRMMDNELAVELRGRINHQTALNHFDTQSDGESNLEPEFDYEDLIVTVAMETDARVYQEVSQPLPTNPESQAGRTLTIPVEDAAIWYVAPETTIGVSAGSRVAYNGDRLVRDDRPRLKAIAAMALAWYGRPRSAISLRLDGSGWGIEPGMLLAEIKSTNERIEVGSIVSALNVTYAGDTITTTIETMYAELDFSGILGSIPGPSTPREMIKTLNTHEGAIQEIREKIVNIPDRGVVGYVGPTRPARNISGLEIPPKSILQIVDSVTGGRRRVQRPDADNLTEVLVSPDRTIPASGPGADFDALAPDDVVGTTSDSPAIGEEMGTAEDSWELHTGKTGFVCRGVSGGDVRFRPFRSAAVDPWLELESTVSWDLSSGVYSGAPGNVMVSHETDWEDLRDEDTGLLKAVCTSTHSGVRYIAERSGSSAVALPVPEITIDTLDGGQPSVLSYFYQFKWQIKGDDNSIITIATVSKTDLGLRQGTYTVGDETEVSLNPTGCGSNGSIPEGFIADQFRLSVDVGGGLNGEDFEVYLNAVTAVAYRVLFPADYWVFA